MRQVLYSPIMADMSLCASALAHLHYGIATRVSVKFVSYCKSSQGFQQGDDAYKYMCLAGFLSGPILPKYLLGQT